MPRNVEMKARLRDPGRAEQIAARLSGTSGEAIHQVDTFFACERGRLKLRILGSDSGELILYERPDLAGARTSRYLIARTPDPVNLHKILSAALETTGTVIKARRLFLVGQTRVHIEAVEGLGSFLELEVVLGFGQGESEGKQIAERLLAEFEIAPDQLIAEAYVDLLRKKARGA